jgi:hypothetical protein
MVYIILSLFILLNLLLYGTYRYNIAQIDTTKITHHKPYNYKDDVYATYWATFAHSSDMKMDSFYTFNFPYALYRTFSAKSINEGYQNDSLTLCNRVAKGTIHDVRREETRVNRGSLTMMYGIWMTHHLTTNEVMDVVFEKSYYANGYYLLESASQGYFHKEVDALSVYELLMLHAIDYAPSRFNPRKHKERLLKRVNMLIKKAKTVFPERYGELEELNKLPEFYYI